MMENLAGLATLLTAVFGSLLTILLGFYKYAQAREKEFEKSREMAAKEYAKSTRIIAKSFNKVSSSLDRVAKASERGADEAKQRNGHLAELQLQGHAMIQEAISTIQNQTVEHQTVKQSTVENETIKKKA